MNQLVESLRRLYQMEYITIEKIRDLKEKQTITEADYKYIVSPVSQ